LDFSSLADWDGTEPWLTVQVEAGSLADTEDATDVGTVAAPCKVSGIAARSVVKVLTGIWVVEAASRLAGSAEVPGALLGEWDIWLDKDEDVAGTVTLFAGAWLELAGDLVYAAPAGLEAEEGAEDGAALEGILEIGTALPFPPPGTQPGTRSAGVAGAGPSVTATQPGKFDDTLPASTFS
jgi:hypothetical protein